MRLISLSIENINIQHEIIKNIEYTLIMVENYMLKNRQHNKERIESEISKKLRY